MVCSVIAGGLVLVLGSLLTADATDRVNGNTFDRFASSARGYSFSLPVVFGPGWRLTSLPDARAALRSVFGGLTAD
jgi:hypothetical protein